jgi:hypothetical protein
MFKKSIASLFAGAALIAITTGCETSSKGVGSESSQDQSATKSKVIADVVDQMLRQQNLTSPGDDRTDSVTAGFLSLKSACHAAGGHFDSALQECLCPNGGFFTTGSSTVSCEELTYSYGSIDLKNLDGVQNDVSDSIMLDINFLAREEARLKVYDEMKALSARTGSEAAKPFRLSFFERSEMYYEIDQSRSAWAQGAVFDDNGLYMSPYGTFDLLYSTVLGAPFETETYAQSNGSFVLYEPNAEFVPAALGQELAPLSQADQVRFSSFGLNASDAETSALSAAYKAFQKQTMFNPTSVSSPYTSGCASYCVASEPLDLGNGHSDYVASFKKIYQLGTPSARVIVVRNKVKKSEAGMISLNVANTISTVNFVTDYTRESLPYPEVRIASYDRYGTFLYQQKKRALTTDDHIDPLQYVRN